MDRIKLFMAMCDRTPVLLPGLQHKVIIDSIEVEDGSGYSFNLAVQIVVQVNPTVPYNRNRKVYLNMRTRKASFVG